MEKQPEQVERAAAGVPPDETLELVEPEALLDTGIIALINLLVLWPRGYALGVARDEAGRVIGLAVRRVKTAIVDQEDGVLEQRVRAFARWHEQRMQELHGEETLT